MTTRRVAFLSGNPVRCRVPFSLTRCRILAQLWDWCKTSLFGRGQNSGLNLTWSVEECHVRHIRHATTAWSEVVRLPYFSRSSDPNSAGSKTYWYLFELQLLRSMSAMFSAHLCSCPRLFASINTNSCTAGPRSRSVHKLFRLQAARRRYQTELKIHTPHVHSRAHHFPAHVQTPSSSSALAAGFDPTSVV